MTRVNIVIKRVVLCVLTLSMISFIFINSMFDAVESSEQSSFVLNLLNSVLHSLHINVSLTEHFVRKSAHFAEYFVLGTLLFLTVKSFIMKLNVKILSASFIGLLIAVVDELIQLTSLGRSAQLSDVVLDFSGVVTSFVVWYIIFKLIINRNSNGKEVLK